LTYHAFVVHPERPGPVALAIAHREALDFVVDLIREQITIDNSVPILRRYGIYHVTGAQEEGDGLNLAHAVLGALDLARKAVA
jgi:hypothetical protein